MLGCVAEIFSVLGAESLRISTKFFLTVSVTLSDLALLIIFSCFSRRFSSEPSFSYCLIMSEVCVGLSFESTSVLRTLNNSDSLSNGVFPSSPWIDRLASLACFLSSSIFFWTSCCLWANLSLLNAKSSLFLSSLISFGVVVSSLIILSDSAFNFWTSEPSASLPSLYPTKLPSFSTAINSLDLSSKSFLAASNSLLIKSLASLYLLIALSILAFAVLICANVEAELEITFDSESITSWIFVSTSSKIFLWAVLLSFLYWLTFTSWSSFKLSLALLDDSIFAIASSNFLSFSLTLPASSAALNLFASIISCRFFANSGYFCASMPFNALAASLTFLAKSCNLSKLVDCVSTLVLASLNLCCNCLFISAICFSSSWISSSFFGNWDLSVILILCFHNSWIFWSRVSFCFLVLLLVVQGFLLL
ncbi:hypothetical protein [Mycoplasmopsis bovigenitalium]|uniref:hypothetical protein n=1 Tax=Mycoplasmopsis bovigenitalium TaxID=2112 RepID=UPI0011E4D26F|nr:hypothetical protein [Mycoplasmopsis bovigenitalium]